MLASRSPAERPLPAQQGLHAEAPTLAVAAVSKTYQGIKALDDVSLDVAPGSILGLIGPNGAGKSTLVNIVTGFARADSGTVRFGAHVLDGLAPDAISRLGLVRTFQVARGFARMTVLENLLISVTPHPGESLRGALLRGADVRASERSSIDRALAIAERLRLTPVLDNFATDISGGQKKLLELGRAMMLAPTTYVLDEPVAGVNPALAAEIADHIRTLRDAGASILIVEHNLPLVRALADRVVVMHQGRLLRTGTFAEVVGDVRVQDAYLGRRT